jgi:ABC-2 type transport system permease protein
VIRLLLSGLWIHFLQMSRSGSELLAMTLWPIIYATIAYYMFGAESDPNVLLTASLGASVMAIWSSVAFSAGGAIELQRRLGTLELLVAAPAPFGAVLAPITLATSAIGVYALAATLLWGRLLFGISLHFEHPLLFAVSLPVAIVAIGMLGLILAATLVLYRAALFLGASFEYPVWLVTGLLVPLSVLPGWVEPISWLLAPTWGMRAIRESAVGGSPLAAIAMCLALSACYAVIAIVCLRAFERLARNRATLALT